MRHPSTTMPRKHKADVPPKPLYLLEGKARQVEIHGESLRIVGPCCPTRAVPLARVCRIVCGPDVQWEGSALCACLSRGIPVTWVDEHGNDAGTAVPRHIATGPVHDALVLYVQLPRWEGRYQNWLRSRRMNVLTNWAGSLGHGDRVPRYVFDDLKRQYVYQNSLADHFVPEARGWCVSVVVQRLISEGIHAQYWAFGGVSLHLAEDLGGLFWADLSLHCGTLAEQIPTGPEALLFFETWVQRNLIRLLHHIGDLKRHLRAENCSWH